MGAEGDGAPDGPGEGKRGPGHRGDSRRERGPGDRTAGPRAASRDDRHGDARSHGPPASRAGERGRARVERGPMSAAHRTRGSILRSRTALTVRPDTTMGRACDTMMQEAISALPVVEDGVRGFGAGG